jgi:hypothetical protein
MLEDIKKQAEEIVELNALNNAMQLSVASSAAMAEIVLKTSQVICEQLGSCKTAGELVDTLKKFREASKETTDDK